MDKNQDVSRGKSEKKFSVQKEHEKGAEQAQSVDVETDDHLESAEVIEEEGVELSKKIKILEEKVEKNYQDYLRALADSENLKRRSEKEKEQLRLFGNESVLKDLLPVLDSFEKAFEAFEEGGEGDSFKNGFEMVYKMMFETLEKQGLKVEGQLGEVFDPNFHQAIKKVESDDVDEEKIEQVFAKGYSLNGRIVRPAMVSVLVPK